VTIPAGGGVKDGEQVLDILAKHPSTAHFISHKICRYFLGDAADTWTGRLAAIYLETGGDVKAMLRPLLLSDELRQGPPILKRPFDFAVSALRALNANTDGNKPLQESLAGMGQPLYQWPMPDGYPDKTSAWTGSLLARWNFGTALMNGRIAGTSVDLAGLRVSDAVDDHQKVDTLLELVLARPADSEAARPLREKLRAHSASVHRSGDKQRSVPIECAALLLASPEFQWR
jgi:hypothetical protein